jgi:hypothetical protein
VLTYAFAVLLAYIAVSEQTCSGVSEGECPIVAIALATDLRDVEVPHFGVVF